MEQVRDAILVAAGLGTRMFPVSALQPKETLPLVDVPLLTHLVMEAKAANIERLHLVLSPIKSLDGFFADQSALATYRKDIDATLFNIAEGLELHTHIQLEPKGVGNAIEAALDNINGPMLIMLGDNLLMDVHAPTTAYQASNASRSLVEAYQNSGEPTVALMEVAPEEVVHYGIVDLDGTRISSIVEKPTLARAPSRFALCGRYVFPATTQRLLQTYSYALHGDLQTIALQEHWMNEGILHGLVLQETQWYDSGSPLLWLQAQVDHALRRPDLSPSMRAWLKRRLND
ncbi:MAG: NTP transferase domain-containing protein [Candidatus Poseidonia sp.]|nr:NTP transferase domain-containing protein [Poseidonia sp.]MBL6747999.1 NTP transferase domain-containing protein [Poseidonia sp.]MBL6806883.1 NTP transferase domain-containing protein [Poseidonia sp.]MBL6885899.1 NTP transferase domain-containing protein [Poseidonia sp.]MBL6892829.1 NTP transferase domain-containing protein [Poseidonia sp.]